MNINYFLITLGSLLREFHRIFALFCNLSTFFIPSTYLQSLFNVWIIMIISNIIFNGCILTKLEYKLTRKNTTIVDPILNLFKIGINNVNRFRITIIMAMINILIILLRIFIIV
jgi:hypothetical protein